MSFYEAYKSFCEQKGIAESRVLRELDISHSVISNWKNGSMPSNRTMRQIADYFGVTVDELKEGYKKIAPPERSDAEKEYVQKFAMLPPEKQAEVLDFVNYKLSLQDNVPGR